MPDFCIVLIQKKQKAHRIFENPMGFYFLNLLDLGKLKLCIKVQFIFYIINTIL